jgi:hypothetical protein
MASDTATVVQATGPVNFTSSSSSLMATSADQSSARVPSTSASHSMLMPRTKGHLAQGLV